jgi:hypothetical protein
LETKFYRKILQVNRNTTTIGIRGELGRHPILLEALTNAIKYKSSITTKAKNALVREAWTEASLLKASSEWLPTVNTINTQLRTSTPHVLNKRSIKKFGKNVLHSLKFKYEDFWHKELNRDSSTQKNKGGNKLRSYNKLKQHFHIEPYLQNVENTTHRKHITQLRLSAHKLNIESLRGTITDPKLRTCNKCTLNETEDEQHFLLRCTAYSNPRHEFMSNLAQSYPNTQLFNDHHWYIFLLTNEDKTCCKALGKYITTCLNIRAQLSPSVVSVSTNNVHQPQQLIS